MDISHQRQNFKQTLFFCVVYLIVLSLAMIPSVQAAAPVNPLFTVENIRVDVTADDSVAAQEQAFTKARKQAFDALVQRLVDEGQIKDLKEADDALISSFISDYEITDEQISSVRYIGTYTFRFSEELVSRYFLDAGLKFTTAPGNRLLVLPYFETDGRLSLWSEGNLWFEAWNRASMPKGLVPVSVPIGDVMDVSDIDDSQELNYQPFKLVEMLARDDAKEAVLIIAGPDPVLASVADPQAPAQGSLRIGIYRTDLGRPEHVKEIVFPADGLLPRNKFYDAAVLKAYQSLQTDWKTKTAAGAQDIRAFNVRIPISGIRDWVRIQGTLNGTAGIEGIKVDSLRPKEVNAVITFRGGEDEFRNVLAQRDLQLGEAITEQAGTLPVYVLLFIGREASLPATQNSFYVPPVPMPKSTNEVQENPSAAQGATQSAPIIMKKDVPAKIVPQENQEFGVHTF